MPGVYRDKTAGHLRVRITVNEEKQKHLGTTHDESVACAMYDLFIHLNELRDSHILNLPRMNMFQLYRLIEKRDPKALEQVMEKSELMLVRSNKPDPMRTES